MRIAPPPPPPSPMNREIHPLFFDPTLCVLLLAYLGGGGGIFNYISLQEVGSVPRAIEFVEAHDKELWYLLIEHSLRNEVFLSGLLDHAGVYDVDLARLVAEIPKGMHIPGLRDKVVKIISDYHFQVGHKQTLGVENRQ